jgi:hypothetical protein
MPTGRVVLGLACVVICLASSRASAVDRGVQEQGEGWKDGGAAFVTAQCAAP